MGLSVTALRQAIRRVERSIESELIDSEDDPLIHDLRSDQSRQRTSVLSKEAAQSGSSTPVGGDGSDDGGLKVYLKDSQLRMAVWLNSLSWKKTLTWYPDVSNSHAIIIVR